MTATPPIVPHLPLLPHLHALIDSGNLRDLWADEDAWQSLSIDYHPPRVERLELRDRIGEGLELVLQRCHACEHDESLWYSGATCSLAVHVLQGTLELRVRHNEQPPTILILPPGASYEIADEAAWYYTRALTETCCVVALFGPVPADLKEYGEIVEQSAAATEDLRRHFGDLLAWNDR